MRPSTTRRTWWLPEWASPTVSEASVSSLWSSTEPMTRSALSRDVWAEKNMHHRLEVAKKAGVPITNYGVAIAEFHGILRRALRPFPSILQELDR